MVEVKVAKLVLWYVTAGAHRSVSARKDRFDHIMEEVNLNKNVMVEAVCLGIGVDADLINLVPPIAYNAMKLKKVTRAGIVKPCGLKKGWNLEFSQGLLLVILLLLELM
jgi:hypothetical protein